MNLSFTSPAGSREHKKLVLLNISSPADSREVVSLNVTSPADSGDNTLVHPADRGDCILRHGIAKQTPAGSGGYVFSWCIPAGSRVCILFCSPSYPTDSGGSYSSPTDSRGYSQFKNPAAGRGAK